MSAGASPPAAGTGQPAAGPAAGAGTPPPAAARSAVPGGTAAGAPAPRTGEPGVPAGVGYGAARPAAATGTTSPAPFRSRRQARRQARQDAWLAPHVDDAGLKGRAVRGAGFTSMSQAVRLLLMVGSTVVLARLLSPEEFGLVGMVLAVTALADLLKEAGLANAVVQRREITQAQVTALFWINTGIGVALALCVVALAPLLGLFYGRAEVVGLAVGMAGVYVVAGLGVQHQALLMRRMRFSAIAAREVAAYTCGVSVAVAAAVLGAGPWSLVALHLTVATVRTLSVWLACSWRPGLPSVRAEGLSPMLKFGSTLSGATMLNYLARNADNVLLGRFAGAAALGLYGRAYSLILLPLQQVTQPLGPVAQSGLARVRHSRARFRKAYRLVITAVALMGLPLVALMVAVADPAVPVLLGEQWEEATVLFRLLAIAGGAQVIATTAGWLYIATERTGAMLRWALVTRPLVVLSFVAGLPWGPEGVATAYAIVTVVLLGPGMANAARSTYIGSLTWTEAAWRPAALALAVAGAALLGRYAAGGAGPVVELLVGTAAGLAAWGAGLTLVPSLRRFLTEALSALRTRNLA